MPLMDFASPIWLLGLLPWAGVVFYLLPGKGSLAAVPFLRFWRPETISPSGTSRKWPASWILMMLMALLLALLAAAKPGWRVAGIGGSDISIVLDRGASMALPSVSGEHFRGVIRKCAQQVGTGETRVTLVAVPGQVIETDTASWAAQAEMMSPTIVRVKLDQAITHQLQQTRGLVFVLTDQRIDLADPRVVQITPDKPEDCVAITAIGAATSPRPQVMVHLENHSDRNSVKLKVTSDRAVVESEVALPTRGKAIDQFVEMPSLTDQVLAEIDSDLAKNPWARAWLLKQRRSGVRIITEQGLPEPVQRMAAVYTKDRPGGADAVPVVISTQRIDENQPGIWIDSRITATGGDAHPPPDFKLSPWKKENLWFAVRENPCRQIWLRADFSQWEKKPDMVTFFRNAFNWLNLGDQRFASINGGTLDQIWPGITGSVAVNAGDFPKSGTPGVINQRAQVRGVFQTVSCQSEILLAALACLGAGVILRGRLH